MDWKIDYWEEDAIVFVKMLNAVPIEGTIQICKEANELARKHNAHKYLVDHRGVGMGMTVLDIDKVPAKFKEIGADFSGETAIVFDPDSPSKDRYEFLRNALFLASMHFELFTDMDKALAWLKSV
jgi:hypothetical protein